MFADLKNSYQKSMPRKSKVKDLEKNLHFENQAETMAEFLKKYNLPSGILVKRGDITTRDDQSIIS
jgi:hypothetical protein